MKRGESDTRESVVSEIASAGERVRAQEELVNEWKAYLNERWYELGKHDCRHGA